MALVILVDERDNPLGEAEKMAAHQNGGQLHRAFSVFVFNQRGELLLQRRAKEKYHFGGLWSNTACGHPAPGQGVVEAATQRLQEEMGFATQLRDVASFVYHAQDAQSGLVEYELDHVLVGRFDGEPTANPDEVDEWRFVDLRELSPHMRDRPDEYTPWFPLAIKELQQRDFFPPR